MAPARRERPGDLPWGVEACSDIWNIMTIELNHTIVASRDKHASSHFLAELLDLPAPVVFGPFLGVTLANGVTLDYIDTPGEFSPQHYAFLVSEDEFTAAFERIQAWGLTYWADPHGQREGEINHNDGGRGVYFTDPSGHFLELITVPYGGWPDD